MTQANNTAKGSSNIDSNGVLLPAGGGTGLSTGTPLASTTAPVTNPATGTPSSTTYLRGDGTWSTPTSNPGTVTSVSGTAPVNVATGTSTPVISMAAATTSVNGYLTSTDWNTFNGKQAAGTYVNSVSGTAPIVSSGGVTPAISMAAATTSVSGYLTSTDWNTFNGKQPAGSYLTSAVTSAVAGTGISVSGATGAVTFTNSGVTSIVAGTGISISGATGAVTVTNSVTASPPGVLGQVFTSSGTFTVPTGVTAVKVTVAGGGGSGGGSANGGAPASVGNSGGTSSFGAYISCTGGQGGFAYTSFVNKSGGSATGADFTIATGRINTDGATATPTGGAAGGPSVPTGSYAGVAGPLGYGGVPNENTAGYGSGGHTDTVISGGGGAGGGYGIKWVTGLTPGGTVTVTVGAGGAAVGSSAGVSQAGTSGIVIVEW